MILPVIITAAMQRLDQASHQGNEGPYSHIAFPPRIPLLSTNPDLKPSPYNHSTLLLPTPSIPSSHLNPISLQTKNA